MDSRELGRRGESKAAWFYRLRGYRIVGRNVRVGRGEIDLIVRRFGVLVFVEVKTRQSRGAGEGFESVDGAKRAQMIELAERYLARRPYRGDVRFDVLSFFWDGSRFVATHFENAFSRTGRSQTSGTRRW